MFLTLTYLLNVQRSAFKVEFTSVVLQPRHMFSMHACRRLEGAIIPLPFHYQTLNQQSLSKRQHGLIPFCQTHCRYSMLNYVCISCEMEVNWNGSVALFVPLNAGTRSTV